MYTENIKNKILEIKTYIHKVLPQNKSKYFFESQHTKYKNDIIKVKNRHRRKNIKP